MPYPFMPAQPQMLPQQMGQMGPLQRYASMGVPQARPMPGQASPHAMLNVPQWARPQGGMGMSPQQMYPQQDPQTAALLAQRQRNMQMAQQQAAMRQSAPMQGQLGSTMPGQQAQAPASPGGNANAYHQAMVNQYMSMR